MGKTTDSISSETAEWINNQKLFFVSTAPLSQSAHVNCSPKGLDTFRILDEKTVAYQDLTGSGIETISHIRENGRITIMFCAFEGAPKILRIYGTGEVITPDMTDFLRYANLFEKRKGTRSIIVIHAHRISDSCGFGVPLFEFKNERETLEKWADAKGTDGVAAYWKEKNVRSIDGIQGL